jgi:LuxR family maltose regulon positive regulatory protein
MATCTMAVLHKRHGQLRQAKGYYEKALELATETNGRRLPAASEPLMGLGELWREWNELDVAEHYLREGIELTRHWAVTSALDGWVSLVRVHQAQGDADGALQALSMARQLAVEFDATQLDDLMVELLQARLWIAQGDPEAAQRWFEACQPERVMDETQPDDGGAFTFPRMRKYLNLARARLRIAQRRPADALALLEPTLEQMEAQQRVDLMIEILILQSLALDAMGRSEEALDALSRALALARPGGYVRSFVDEGAPLAGLLYRTAARDAALPGRDAEQEYASELLAAFSASERTAMLAERPLELVEPLSERELEVLGLIAQGLSNREIAQRLFLSLPTVKWHTHNIYGKLAVKNRTQAVAKARALRLLPPG